MTYQEMKAAEAEYLKAINGPQKVRGATKAQLQHRAKVLGLCVACTEPLTMHTREQMLTCATVRG